ncbi:MAG TPA: 4'-phosphopantetheinyl transferase superfamily protein [Gammaproteobacteria bacterium]|nr:4'-phosphopantetheinyl transferase superfamily protein [Gammaproteobacteria bacterium]
MLIDTLHQEAHVWSCIPESVQGDTTLHRLKSLLSDEELDQHRRFHFPADSHRYLVSHALVRRALSSYIDIPPSDWHFSRNEHGRPEIANPGLPPLRFNLTHTDGLACCLVTLVDDCGIDAEKIRDRHNPVAIAARMFSPAEHAGLLQLQGKEQLEDFFRRWTLREAYVKARGIGLSLPTRKLHFQIRNTGAIEVGFDDSIDDDGDNWMFQLWQSGPEHIVATAIARRPGLIKKLLVRPLQP